MHSDDPFRPRPDPRMLLLLGLVLDAFAVAPGPLVVCHCICAVVVCALLALGRWRRALGFAAVYTVLMGLGALPHLVQSPVSTMVGVAAATTARYSLPVGVALVYYSAMRVSALTAALRSVRMPEVLVVPLAVTFRFLPTVAEESRAVMDAYRMRGRAAARGPFAVVEAVLVPMIVSVLRVGEELTASALTRGLGSPGRPTSIVRLAPRPADAVWVLIGLLPVALALYLWWVEGR